MDLYGVLFRWHFSFYEFVKYISMQRTEDRIFFLLKIALKHCLKKLKKKRLLFS